MSILGDVEEAATGSPYVLIAKVVGIALFVVLFVTLCMSWLSRGQEIKGLQNWQKGVTETATYVTVAPDAKGVRKPLDPSQVVVALDTLHDNFQRDEALIKSLSDATAAAKTRADNADAALANANVVLEKQYASSTKRIDALQTAKPGATLADQCASIVDDSKAAWESWK